MGDKIGRNAGLQVRPVSGDLVDRLVLAKYLLNRARDELEKGGHFAPGIAVSGMQDAAEVLLRTAADFYDVPVNQREEFPSLVDKVHKVETRGLTGVSSLHSLNSARWNFKHQGNPPTERTARNFASDLEDIFRKALVSYFEIEYDDLSLFDLIENFRVRSWLSSARTNFDKEEYDQAVASTAVAAAIYWRYAARSGSRAWFDSPMRPELSEDLARILSQIVTRISDHDQSLALVMYRIPLLDYYKFVALTPEVTFTCHNRPNILWVYGAREKVQREDAKFCIEFVVDSVLSMQDLGVDQPRNLHKVKRKVALH